MSCKARKAWRAAVVLHRQTSVTPGYEHWTVRSLYDVTSGNALERYRKEEEMARLRKQDYDLVQRIGGVEIRPAPSSWLLTIGLWILVPIIVVVLWFFPALGQELGPEDHED